MLKHLIKTYNIWIPPSAPDRVGFVKIKKSDQESLSKFSFQHIHSIA